MKPVILVTNDDGVYSPGLRLLFEAVSDLGETIVVVPETPKSSTGMGLTLHKPLRAYRINYHGMPMYLLNGTPSDIIHFAHRKIVSEIDLVVSGVNIGDNTSIQVILSSGTVAAAVQAWLLGIPSIAFSVAIESGDELEHNILLAETIKKISRTLVEKVLKEGLIDADFLNVNFPSEITEKTRVVTAKPARLRFIENIEERVDPRGKKYYWIYGVPAPLEKNSDTYELLVQKNIVITPIKFEISCPLSAQLARLENILNNVLRSVIYSKKR
ncbi:MAG: 5'/3'-nucleotidase SurE [Thermoprotei archaeon]|nr:MAG: 5'/3'-nucleotidase SurE [Thermoprotei archaeon]RLF00778.1 MAG: 5'/3'-nucleotidase SurE [Thermoprotei archaeon]